MAGLFSVLREKGFCETEMFRRIMRKWKKKAVKNGIFGTEKNFFAKIRG